MPHAHASGFPSPSQNSPATVVRVPVPRHVKIVPFTVARGPVPRDLICLEQDLQDFQD